MQLVPASPPKQGAVLGSEPKKTSIISRKFVFKQFDAESQRLFLVYFTRNKTENEFEPVFAAYQFFPARMHIMERLVSLTVKPERWNLIILLHAYTLEKDSFTKL